MSDSARQTRGPDLSIVVVSYNTAELLGRCIHSVLAQQGPSFELIVVDNASTDDSLSVVRQAGDDIHLIANDANLGFSRANNQAVRISSGRYIYFLNPDTEVRPGSFHAMIRYMDANPEVGLAGTRILNPNGSRQSSVEYRYPGQRHEPDRFQGLKGDIAWLLGASIVARYGVVEDLGGFSETYFLYAEDIDICLRARLAGWLIGFVEDATVVHWGGQSESHTPSAEVWRKKIGSEILFYKTYFSDKAFRSIRRSNRLQAYWRLLTLRMEGLFRPGSRAVEEKTVKYQAIIDAYDADARTYPALTKLNGIETKFNQQTFDRHERSTKKKIAVIRSTYSPFGGAETLALDVLHAILRNSCPVHLLTSRGQKWPLEDPLLTTVFLPVSSNQRLLEAWSFNRSATHYLRNHQFDIVFSIDRVTSYTHLHAGGGTHKTFLATKNRVSSFPERLFRKTSLYHRYILQLERNGFRNPRLQKIHCCSKMVADDIRNDYRVPVDKLQVIYNGIPWEDIGAVYNRRQEVANRICHEEHLDPQSHWLLFLGSGYRRKGLDLAVQGLATLPESYRLLVVGAGTEARIRRQADRLGLGDRIRILGPRTGGWRYASLCCAMVLPSRYEPFGLAAAEAQAMGLPVLVSDRTGYGELIEEGVTGVRLASAADVTGVNEAFHDLARLVERPAVSSDEIRERTRHLDNRIILDRMIHEFLELQMG